MKDNRNEELEVGQVVAYNLSGEIKLLHAAGGHAAGHISTVRGPKSVLVLRTKDA